MKFSGTLTVQYDTPFSPFKVSEYQEGLQWLIDSKFDGAELCISNYEGVDIHKIKAELDSRKLGCSTISTGQARTLEDISLLHTGSALKRAQERMKQHIDAASILGSKVTLGLMRGIGTPGREEQDKQILAKNLETVILYAEEKQVTIMLEAINRYETSLFNSADTTISFIKKELGNPERMGVLWDLFHANIEDAEFDEAVDLLGTRLRHVHLADSNRMFPGYGHTDFERICKKIKASGFQDYMSFECLNLPSIEIVRRSSGEFVRKILNIVM